MLKIIAIVLVVLGVPLLMFGESGAMIFFFGAAVAFAALSLSGKLRDK